MQALIVDDEPNIGILVAKILELEGYETSVVHGGSEALDMLAANEFDLLVLDLMMPGVSGFGVLEALEIRASATPTIIMTAAPELAPRGYKVLSKPFSIAELVTLLPEAAQTPFQACCA